MVMKAALNRPIAERRSRVLPGQYRLVTNGSLIQGGVHFAEHKLPSYDESTVRSRASGRDTSNNTVDVSSRFL